MFKFIKTKHVHDKQIFYVHHSKAKVFLLWCSQ